MPGIPSAPEVVQRPPGDRHEADERVLAPFYRSEAWSFLDGGPRERESPDLSRSRWAIEVDAFTGSRVFENMVASVRRSSLARGARAGLALGVQVEIQFRQPTDPSDAPAPRSRVLSV